MVVAEILGVVKLVTPVPPVNGDPPVAAAYQSIVSPEPTAPLIVTVPFPQREFPVPVGAVGNAFTVTFAVSVAIQPLALVTVKVYTVVELADRLTETADGF